MNRTPIHIFAIAFFLLHPAASTLKISPEETGRNNQAFPRLAGTLQTDERNEGGTGSKAIERKDRQEDKVYYSTTTKEEEAERRQEEKEKARKILGYVKKYDHRPQADPVTFPPYEIPLPGSRSRPIPGKDKSFIRNSKPFSHPSKQKN